MALRTSADGPRLFLYSIVGFVAGLFLLYAGFVWLKRKRLVEDIPTSKVRSIAMGLVEVKGKAHPAAKNVMTSPLTGKKCVYYKYMVEKLVSSGKSSHWVKVKGKNSIEPFYLQDNTGKVMVDPKKAGVHTPMSYHSQSKWGKDPEPTVKKFLDHENIRFEGSLFGMNYTMRYREWMIAPGTDVYVMGEAADNPYVEEGTAQQGVEDIMITRGKDKIMMISTKKEKQILNSLKWKSLFAIAGGALLTTLCILFILNFIFRII